MFKNLIPIPNLESAIDILSSEYMDKLQDIFFSFDSFEIFSLQISGSFFRLAIFCIYNSFFWMFCLTFFF